MKKKKTAPCQIQMAVDANGMVAIVHVPGTTIGTTSPFFHLNRAVNYFSLFWDMNIFGEEMYPSPENDCGHGSCLKVITHGSEKCLCNATVLEEEVFSSLPTREQVLSELHLGAFPPDKFDDGTYTLIESSSEVDAYDRTHSSSLGSFSIETIFKVLDERRQPIYLKNMKSTVVLGEGKYMIRNPPNFMDPLGKN